MTSIFDICRQVLIVCIRTIDSNGTYSDATFSFSSIRLVLGLDFDKPQL